MKLKNLIPHRTVNRVIRQFGTAQLIQNADGTHDLVGGTRDDIAAANEWVSLFAHDIVFRTARKQFMMNCRVRRKKFSPRLGFAW
jgi:hypothetical protein